MKLVERAPVWAARIHRAIGADLPIPPEKVCDLLKIEYRRRVMHPCVDGLCYRTHTGISYIFVNSYFRRPGRQRFTAGHEIGHCLIARATGVKRHQFVDSQHTAYSLIEVAANRFASALLMPEDLVRSFFRDLSGNRSYRIQIMAERFGVTQQALRIRLQQLGITPQHTRDVPNSDDLPPWHNWWRI